MITNDGEHKKAREIESPQWVPYARYSTNNYGHCVWQVEDSEIQSKHTVPVHRLQAVAEYGIDSVKNKDVHHKNGIPWDNRIGNLELLTRADHIREHRQGNPDVSDEELLLDLRAGREFLGYRPRIQDYDAFSSHSSATLHKRFGSFQEALEVAGIDPETGSMTPFEEWAKESDYVEVDF